jgi:hypothetical protein
LRGEVRSHRTRGNAGVHLNQEARSGATGHVAVLESIPTGRQGLELQGMRQRMDARPATCLVLKPVRGVPGLQGTVVYIFDMLSCRLLFTVLFPSSNCLSRALALCSYFTDLITCIIIDCICSYCPCFAGGSYCSEKCGCQPCFNKDAFAETVQNTRKVLVSRQKRMSLKINRRSEANAETMVCYPNSIR